MLIKCPECGNNVSDKAINCIHCGFPLHENIHKTGNDIDEYKLFLVDYDRKSFLAKTIILSLCDNKNVDYSTIINSMPYMIKEHIEKDKYSEIKDVLRKNTLVKMILIKQNENIFESNEYIEYLHDKDIVTCPKCGSSVISAGQKGFSIITGFVGSNKTVNRCAKCGYSWKP